MLLSVVGLAIVRQPFPAVMTQKEQLTDNQLVVKFITGTALSHKTEASGS